MQRPAAPALTSAPRRAISDAESPPANITPVAT